LGSFWLTWTFWVTWIFWVTWTFWYKYLESTMPVTHCAYI
jgi:hypothetical protein